MNDGEIGKRKLDSVVQTAITISSVVENAGGSFKVIFSENGIPKTISGNQYDLCNNLYRIKAESQINTKTLINHAKCMEIHRQYTCSLWIGHFLRI